MIGVLAHLSSFRQLAAEFLLFKSLVVSLLLTDTLIFHNSQTYSPAFHNLNKNSHQFNSADLRHIWIKPDNCIFGPTGHPAAFKNVLIPILIKHYSNRIKQMFIYCNAQDIWLYWRKVLIRITHLSNRKKLGKKVYEARNTLVIIFDYWRNRKKDVR